MDSAESYVDEEEDKIVERIKREFEFFLDKKYCESLDPEQTKSLIKDVLGKHTTVTETEKIRLSPGQVKELQAAIEKSLGVELRPE